MAYASRCKTQASLATLWGPATATAVLAPPPTVGVPSAASVPIGTAEVVAVAFDHGADRAELTTPDGTALVLTKEHCGNAAGKRKASPAPVPGDPADDSTDDDEPPRKRHASATQLAPPIPGSVAPTAVLSDGPATFTTTPSEDTQQRLPSMVSSSRSEVVLVAHVLSAFGAGGQDALIKALNDGKSRGRTDAAFVDLPGLPETWFEYDPGWTHGEDRIQDDVRKTLRMLTDAPADALVVRLRENAPSIDEHLPNDDRLLIIETTDAKPSRLAALLGTRIAECGSDRLSDAMKARLRKLDGAKDKAAENTAHALLLRIDREYKRDLERLQEIVGEGDARRLVCTHGVKSRIGEFVEGIQALKVELALTHEQMVSIATNDSVSGRVGATVFRTALVSLKAELSLSTEQLVSIAGNDGTASRVERVAFRTALVSLKTELGLSTAQLVSIAGNDGTASRVERVAFRTALVSLKTELGLSTEQLVSIAGNNCAAGRVERVAFRTTLVSLKTELGLSAEQLASIAGNGCAASRVERVAFRNALASLKTELSLSTAQLVSIAGNSCAAKRLECDGYRAAIVAIATPMSNRAALCRLMKNNGTLASRVTTASAADMAAIVTHLNGLSLDGGVLLHTLLGKSTRMIDRLHLLRAKVESITEKAVMVKFVKSCKGDHNKNRDAVALAL